MNSISLTLVILAILAKAVDSGAIPVSKFPQLRRLAWNMAEDSYLTADEALSLYERNWRHLDHDALSPEESYFIDHLVRTVGNGTLLV